MEKNGQFRFTPPTHVLVAFHQALKEHANEGGVPARGARYGANRDTLIDAMRVLGFETLLDDVDAGPIIQTFLTPADPKFRFEAFYEALRARGYAIYPGKLTKRPSFRIGTIGKLDPQVMRGVVQAIKEVMHEMGVNSAAPAGDKGT
jgi:2-aminoethylphosphonate-pyruvate transaminase